MKKRILLVIGVAMFTTISYSLFSNDYLAIEKKNKINEDTKKEDLYPIASDVEDSFNFIEPDTDEKNVEIKLTMEEYEDLLNSIPEGSELVIDEEVYKTLPDEIQEQYNF